MATPINHAFTFAAWHSDRLAQQLRCVVRPTHLALCNRTLYSHTSRDHIAERNCPPQKGTLLGTVSRSRVAEYSY